MNRPGTIVLVAPSLEMALVRDEHGKDWLAPFNFRGKFVLDEGEQIHLESNQGQVATDLPEVGQNVWFVANDEEPSVLMWAPIDEYDALKAHLDKMRTERHTEQVRLAQEENQRQLAEAKARKDRLANPKIRVFRKGEQTGKYASFFRGELLKYLLEYPNRFPPNEYSFQIETENGEYEDCPPPYQARKSKT